MNLKEGESMLWYRDYIKAVKRELRDKYGFEATGGTEQDPILPDVPDGEYPMTIEGKLDRVTVKNGFIDCCNFTD